MADKLVKHIMHSGVIGCKLNTPLSEVVRILSDTDIHALVVTDERGEVRGIISHMDILPLYEQDLADRVASQVMSDNVIGVSPDSPVAEAVKIMVEKRIHRLVVTEAAEGGSRPVGVLSTTDIVREMRGSKWTWYL